MKIAITDNFRVWFEDGTPIALMSENGHDTIYELRRATKQFKDQLFTPEVVEEIK